MKRVIRYLLITFIFTYTMWGLQLLAQGNVLPAWVSLFGNLAVFGPFVGFFVDAKKEQYSFKSLFKDSFPKWTYFITIATPFLLSSISYLIYIFVKDQPFELGLSIQMIVPVAIIILLVGGPIEEFGWRGVLHPLVRKKYSFLVAGLIVGLIHGLWHIPLHFIEGSVQSNIPIWEFTAITMLNGVVYAFLYEYSKNLLPMIYLHWMANLSSAIFMYWVDPVGRYLLFGFTLLELVILTVIYQKRVRN